MLVCSYLAYFEVAQLGYLRCRWRMMWGPREVTFDRTTGYQTGKALWVLSGSFKSTALPSPFDPLRHRRWYRSPLRRRPARRRLVALILGRNGGSEGADGELGVVASPNRPRTPTEDHLGQRANRYISSISTSPESPVPCTMYLQIGLQSVDKAKKNALRTAMRVSELLVDTVNGGVEDSFINEKRVELEIRALASTIMRYKKQTDQWLAASHALNTVIKEIGDFENWMKIMDFDCKSINAAIRNIHQM
ncbi:GCN5-like protein 1 (GCN5L1) [Musa troglodytarum]|uniref:Biogenesis of lysosome-related organelles complex 1 subunit 1 n=1 Tax=Musa troglodytarum TaxID=320322 RepID=A0A9E7LBF8_9LILI|nr:GCN5-like protein 1 (GCN5L1) [Musa troglodytarum]URE44538.1 GCN5-like protein 1 (GCN5L1) [Musa troglodytarum]URE44539.1 GCN5-like protein 1 (GCN5L1) [Musa troglodytarum]